MRRLLVPLLGLTIGCEGLIGSPPAVRKAPVEAPADPDQPAVPEGSDDEADTCTSSGRGNAPSLTRRLTAPEYAATVEAALGLPTDRLMLASEVRIQGFTNDYGNLLPAQQVVTGFRDYGRALTDRLVEDRGVWLGHSACGASDEQCVRSWISRVAEPLFRRPVRDEESAAFAELFSVLISDGVDPSAAAGGTLRALLLAPQTVYRLEDSSKPSVTPLELASRLAFFVTGRGPDAELLEAALSGALDEPLEVEAHVRRLLRTESAGAALDRLSYGWLHLDRLEGLTPTGDATFDRELVNAALALVRAVWLEDGGELRDVFSADFVIPCSDRVARRQGVEGATVGARASVATDPRRAGLLTEPAVSPAPDSTASR